MLMKHIILAQNISTAKDGLEDIIKNLDILNNSKIKHTLHSKDIKINTNYYLDKLTKDNISIGEVDEILNFISKQHKAIFDIFS